MVMGGEHHLLTVCYR